jgi:hypothetical protein
MHLSPPISVQALHIPVPAVRPLVRRVQLHPAGLLPC